MPNGNRTILSLDLGSRTGFARSVDGKIIESGSVDFFSKDTHPGTRFVRFHNWLNTNAKDVDWIVYEMVPRFESAAAARVYCGLLAVLQMYCLVTRKTMTSYKATTVKKLFTGKGNSKKDETCRVCHRLGWKNGHPDTDVDHDEADAIALLWVMLTENEMNPTMVLA